MLEVAKSEDKKDSNIVPSSQYNIGRAYFMVRRMRLEGGVGLTSSLFRVLVCLSPTARQRSGGARQLTMVPTVAASGPGTL